MKSAIANIVANVLGTISSIACVVGIILFFTGSESLIIWFAAFSIFSSLMNVIFGDQNGLTTEILLVVLGVIVSALSSLSLLQGIALVICIGDVITQTVGYIFLIVLARKQRKPA